MQHRPYVGRFAPSPTGPLHLGSLVAALASWLDAKAHNGQWLVRMEDVDTHRCSSHAAHTILQQLAACGLHSDGPVWVQSQRHAAYQNALEQLQHNQWAYVCTCTRQQIAQASINAQRARHQALRYHGVCRPVRGHAPANFTNLNDHKNVPQSGAWRMRTDDTPSQHIPPSLYFKEGVCHWVDRRLGLQTQQLANEVGDFVLWRADGIWSYQLAVVVDDAAQGVTHVVRGQDLLDNTPRQIWLQHALGLAHPHWSHAPLVLNSQGEKLSKQSGAAAFDTAAPLQSLNQAAMVLGLPPAPAAVTLADALLWWVHAWSDVTLKLPRTI